jgi:hypothetical protein
MLTILTGILRWTTATMLAGLLVLSCCMPSHSFAKNRTSAMPVPLVTAEDAESTSLWWQVNFKPETRPRPQSK